MKPSLLFLTLKVFSATGGIEKVSRIAGKALYDLGAEQGFDVRVFSAYDRFNELDARYFPGSTFKGFGANRQKFVFYSVKAGRKAAVVVLSHVNLLSVGYTIKQLSPSTKLVLLAHGIEVWRALPAWKIHMLQACDLVLPVSRFTRDKLVALYRVDEERLHVINNCIDPFLRLREVAGDKEQLRERYNLSHENQIILTVTRLAHKERYKGYDDVLMAVKALKCSMPRLRYLVVGKYDDEEKARLSRLVIQQGLENEVIFAGFVPDDELAAHFRLADVYVMPSRKEGFGIVFIEALFYGIPVIAGNADGSVDALAEGRFGLLVNPDRPNEIREALVQVLEKRNNRVPQRADVLARFGFAGYKKALAHALKPFLKNELTHKRC